MISISKYETLYWHHYLKSSIIILLLIGFTWDFPKGSSSYWAETKIFILLQIKGCNSKTGNVVKYEIELGQHLMVSELIFRFQMIAKGNCSHWAETKYRTYRQTRVKLKCPWCTAVAGGLTNHSWYFLLI